MVESPTKMIMPCLMAPDCALAEMLQASKLLARRDAKGRRFILMIRPETA